MNDTILQTVEDGVLAIKLNRPEKRNAVTDEMYRAFGAALSHARDDESIGAVLIAAAGDHFCAGRDITEFAAINAAGRLDPTDTPAARVIRLLIGFEKPIVAAVEGIAVGFGTTMLLHCDAVYVTPATRLTCGFVQLGLSPEACSSLLLPALIGHQRAFAMLALGLPIVGAEAVSLGLALHCVETGAATTAAMATARALAALPAAALQATKRLMRSAARQDEVSAEELAVFAERLSSGEAGRAFAAFTQRRAAGPDRGTSSTSGPGRPAGR